MMKRARGTRTVTYGDAAYGDAAYGDGFGRTDVVRQPIRYVGAVGERVPARPSAGEARQTRPAAGERTPARPATGVVQQTRGTVSEIDNTRADSED